MLMRWLRRFRPFRTPLGSVALVELDQHRRPVADIWRPLTGVRLFSGRTWTLSLIRQEPTVIRSGVVLVERDDITEAIDVLECDLPDPSEAASVLRRALDQPSRR